MGGSWGTFWANFWADWRFDPHALGVRGPPDQPDGAESSDGAGAKAPCGEQGGGGSIHVGISIGRDAPVPQEGDRVEIFGQSCTWTKHHQSWEKLEPLRQEGDDDADAVAELMLRDKYRGDVLLFGCGEDGQGEVHPAMKRLMDKCKELPDWLDEAKLAEGQALMVRFLPAALYWMYYASLVGGFSFPNITKVLLATGYLCGSPDKVRTRLMDTFRMVLAVTVPGQMRPGGEGWREVVRVRLLHARVRCMLRRRPYWRAEEWGVPINQEDLSAVLLAFSLQTFSGVEKVACARLTPRQRGSYLHLWRYVGFVIGVKDEHNPCSSHLRAETYLQSFAVHQLKPNGDSATVANHLLRFMGGSLTKFRVQMARKILGNPMGDALALDKEDPSVGAQTVLRLWILRVYTWLSMAPLGGWAVAALHSLLVRRMLRGMPFTVHPLQMEPAEKGFAPVCPLGQSEVAGGPQAPPVSKEKAS